MVFRQNVSHRWDAVAEHNGALLKLGRLVTAQCGNNTHSLAEATSFSGHLLPTSTSIPLDIMEKDSIIRTPLTSHFCVLMSECSRMVPTQKRNACEPCQRPTCIKHRKSGRSFKKKLRAKMNFAHYFPCNYKKLNVKPQNRGTKTWKYSIKILFFTEKLFHNSIRPVVLTTS